MFKDLRWKGIMVLFLGYLSTYFIHDFILLIYKPKNVMFFDDTTYLYIRTIFFYGGIMLFMGFYFRSMNREIVIESPAKEWGMILIPFYNSILFMNAKSNIPGRKNKSMLFGGCLLFWQMVLFFPWSLFREPFDISNYQSSGVRTLEEIVGTIASTGMIVTWIIYVFSLNGENKWLERPELQTSHHRFIIRDLSRGIGPQQAVRWIILIPVLLALTFLDKTNIDLYPLQYFSGSYKFHYMFEDITDSQFYWMIWAVFLRATAVISLIVLSYQVFRMLYGLNVGEAPSAGLAVGLWFIPGAQTYWNYGSFVTWRKHFEKGTRDMALTAADNPDKRILRFAGIVFLFYMLRPFMYWIYQSVISQLYHNYDQSGFLFRYYKTYIAEVLSVFWIPENMNWFVTIALTAYILHVCELAAGLKKAALKKMIALGEASPDALQF